MGEYANFGGSSVKIGTCEDMYYLRYDQRHRVTPQRGSVRPVEDAEALRFRFPWPDEDDVQPGSFDRYDRSVAVRGIMPPDGVKHYNVQCSAQAGYVMSIPCPESTEYADGPHGGRQRGDLRVARNGFHGSVLLRAQKFVPDVGLVPILACGGCGAMWRTEGRHEIEAIAVALRSEADLLQLEDGELGEHAKWLHKVADRVLDGLAVPA